VNPSVAILIVQGPFLPNLAHNRIYIRFGGSFYPRICDESSRYLNFVLMQRYRLVQPN